jgi:hypothetical protein
LLVIAKCCQWFFLFDELFGRNSLVYLQTNFTGGFRDGAFFLINHNSPSLNLCMLVLAVLVASGLLLVQRTTYIIECVLWLVMLNLHNRVYTTLTGGDQLLNQIMFFNCFIHTSLRAKDSFANGTAILISNLAIAALLIQVCVVYLVAGLAKITDPQWISGFAPQLISGVAHFSANGSYQLPSVISFILAFIVMIYQLGFPFLIWFRKFSLPLIWTGILIHLYIAFITGLPGFSAVMMLPYVYFRPTHEKP